MENKQLSIIEQRAQRAEELSAFSGIKLTYIRNQIEKILALIGRNGIFDEYTRHDISHIDQLLAIAEWIIPEQTTQMMTHADWLMLVLAIYFHDMGMLVTKKEFVNRNQNPDYLKYKSKYDGAVDKKLTPDAEERFYYQEYVRTNHAKRINSWIKGPFGCLTIEDVNDIIVEIGKF